MPWGSWINDLPTEFFMVVRIAALALGAGFAWLAYKSKLTLLGAAFTPSTGTRINEVDRGESVSLSFDALGTYHHVARCTSRAWTAR